METPPPHRPLIGRNLEYSAEIVENLIFTFAFISPELQIVIVPQTNQPSRLSVFIENRLSFESVMALFRQKPRNKTKNVLGIVGIPSLTSCRSTYVKRSLGCARRP